MRDAFPMWESAKAELVLRMGDVKLRSAKQAMAQLGKAADVLLSL